LITFPFQIIHTLVFCSCCFVPNFPPCIPISCWMQLFLGYSHLWTPLLSLFSSCPPVLCLLFSLFLSCFRRFPTLWAQGRYLYTVFIAAAPYTAYSYLAFLTSAPCHLHSLAPLHFSTVCCKSESPITTSLRSSADVHSAFT